MTAVGVARRQLDLGAVADAVLGLLEQVEQLLDRLAGDLGGLQERPALVGDPVDPAVDPVAARVAEVVLHVADDRVLPVDEPDRAVGPDLEVGGAEVGVGRGDDRLDLGAGEARVVVLELVLEDALEADDVGDQQVPLHALGEVAAGEDLDAGAGPGALLVDRGRAVVLAGPVELAREQSAVIRARRRCRR